MADTPRESDDLVEAIEQGDAQAVFRWFVVRDMILAENAAESDADSKAAVTAEFDEFAALVAFSSQRHAASFAAQMPDMLAADGRLPTFTVSGETFLTTLSNGFGVLLDPETEDAVVVPPDLLQEAQKCVGQPLMEPLATVQIDVPEDRMQHTPLQREVFEWLESRGFRPARWLPKPNLEAELRPAEEIAGRLMALAATFSWVSAPAEVVPDTQLSNHIKTNRLRHWLTDEEAEILTMPRAKARGAHANSIGWKLENMWPLAWILGFEPEPTIEAAQIGNSVSGPIMLEFLPGLDGTLADLLAESNVRPRDEVIALEYRFYCAHNAVRSAQLGRDTVPQGFHPLAHGGAVHERRHSLTWALSPGTPWDQTDLST